MGLQDRNYYQEEINKRQNKPNTKTQPQIKTQAQKNEYSIEFNKLQQKAKRKDKYLRYLLIPALTFILILLSPNGIEFLKKDTYIIRKFFTEENETTKTKTKKPYASINGKEINIDKYK